MRDGLSDLHPSRAIARRLHDLESELEQARAYRRRHSRSPETTGRWGLELPAAPQQEEGWFITYLDMMTLLLVVMIVMLAFSGTLGGQTGASAPDSASAASVAADSPLLAPGARQLGETPAQTQASSTIIARPGIRTTLPAGSAPTEPAPTPAAPAPEAQADTPEPPKGEGLLPAGSGLLPGSIDTAAVSEPLPGWTASWDIPQPGFHPADVGPLPRDAQEVARSSATPPQAGSSPLYPGWSSADLAASFIGPRLPVEPAAPVSQETPAAATSTESVLAATDDNAPSEGETLAAGLSLGELGNDVEVVVNERSVSFRVNSEILFDSSQADLSRSGLGVLRRIVGVLSDTSHEVTVEGHTDSVPVRRNVRYPSNWELSSARAGSVVRYLQANGISRNRLKAVGYADTRAIADNNTPDGRASNRRVELLIEKREP